jgi:hypothetical protein
MVDRDMANAITIAMIANVIEVNGFSRTFDTQD